MPFSRRIQSGCGPRMILVADDEEASRRHCVNLLNKEGFSTVEVTDGANAIRCIRDGFPDMAIVEADLPDRPGLDVVRASARLGARVPIILCSSSHELPRAVHAIKHGAADYLVKPCDQQLLSNAIRGANVARQLEERRARERDERLCQAQRLETIGRLAHDVAHEFNNLLTVVYGYAELLREVSPIGDPWRANAEEIIRAAVPRAELTWQLSTFTCQKPVKMRSLDLNEVIAGVRSLLDRFIGKNIDVSVRFAPDLDLVWADLAQIEQVILNLVLNARDAMPGGGELFIQTANVDASHLRRQVPAGAYVLLSIRDTGTGMSEEIMDRLFEPFFTTKKPGEGTGLGLTVVASIVKQTQGYVVVSTKRDVGTLVNVYLPRRTAGIQSDEPIIQTSITPGRI